MNLIVHIMEYASMYGTKDTLILVSPLLTRYLCLFHYLFLFPTYPVVPHLLSAVTESGDSRGQNEVTSVWEHKPLFIVYTRF